MTAAPKLRALQQLVQDGTFALEAEYGPDASQRIGDLIVELARAEAALADVGADALGAAMAKLVRIRWLTGHAWRRYMAGSAFADDVRRAIDAALAMDRAYVEFECSRRIAERSEILMARCDGDVSLLCASCSAPAIAFVPTPTGYAAARLGEISTAETWTGAEADRLRALLAAGDPRTLIERLRVTSSGACDAYCDACERVYCGTHLAVESTWSGTWHESTYATCAFGHEREIE